MAPPPTSPSPSTPPTSPPGLGGQLHLPGIEESVLVSSASIHRILCDSTITPIATTLPLTLVTGGATAAGGCTGAPQWWQDRTRTVRYVGRGLGTVPSRLRRALEARDAHCAFPGCRVQVDRTRTHHVRGREHGRDTSLANPVPLCVRPHHVVHDGGWVITPRADTSPGTTGHWELAPADRPPPP